MLIALSLILLAAVPLSAQPEAGENPLGNSHLLRLENFAAAVREQVLTPDNEPFSLLAVLNRIGSPL
ncbi:MAG: hypothetical protein KKB51_04900 [Candidatus Riflebacteria bacterium]|nr:hypothetical protein [Candidatus Riflebacteria bacterium]